MRKATLPMVLCGMVLSANHAFGQSSIGSPNLAHLWDTVSPSTSCVSPAVSGFVSTSFSQPTLAENQQGGTPYGAVYLPAVCVITNSAYSDCGTAAMNGAVASGVPVFTNCPNGHQ